MQVVMLFPARYLGAVNFLCKIFIGQFFEERQVLAHFSHWI
jgi:hypothetical protein